MTTPLEAMPRHELERKLRRSRTLNLLLGALAIAALVFGGVQWAGAGGPEAGEGASAQAPGGNGAGGGGSEVGDPTADGTNADGAVQLERRIEGDPMAIGAIDAPVVLNEWIDFRCPFCAVFSRDTFPQLVEEYVDSGEVRIEMHDVAYFGDESLRAAAAARAAGEQGRYFEFVGAVYEAAPESGHPELPVEQLLMLAEQAGVPDLERFEADMQRDDLVAAVQESTSRAQQLGVSGVPFFAVGEQAFSGAQPIESFRQFLDEQLAGA